MLGEREAAYAASIVCPYCAGHHMPDEPRCHVAFGPNSAGNYMHFTGHADSTVQCRASGLWSYVRHRFQRTPEQARRWAKESRCLPSADDYDKLCRKREGEAHKSTQASSLEFPDIGCDGECGFIRAGIGWQCREGAACGRYIHPGDEHYDEVAAYYRRENSDDDRREGEP